MDIYINGKIIEYEIEKESTVGEAISGLQQWLAQQGCVIVSVRLEGKSVNFLEDAAVRNALIQSATRMDVEVQNAKVLVVETIGELAQYLDRVARLAPTMHQKEMKDDAMEQLIEGLHWSEDVLKRVEEILRISYRDIDFEGERMHKLLLKLGDLREHIQAAHEEKNHAALAGILNNSLTPLCDRLVRALPLILEKAQIKPAGADIEEELSEQLLLISDLPEKLESIAVKISLGDSIKGMEEFATCVTSLERTFVLIDRCRNELPVICEHLDFKGKTFEESNHEVSEILQELIGAFERKDRVLIGDLIEYEIAPLTETLTGILEKIRNSLKGSCH